MIHIKNTKQCFRVLAGGRSSFRRETSPIHLSQKDWTTLCGLGSREYYGVMHSTKDQGHPRCEQCHKIAAEQGLEAVPYNSLGSPVEREIESAY